MLHREDLYSSPNAHFAEAMKSLRLWKAGMGRTMGTSKNSLRETSLEVDTWNNGDMTGY
jgi:hypothetical protein